MPKSKARRTKAASSGRSVAWGGPAKAGDRRWNYVILAVVVAAVGYGAFAWWTSARTETDFLALAEQGRDGLAAVRSSPSQGRDHLAPGQSYSYASAFPTSGPHDPTPTAPGLYRTQQPPTRLVHALEHGNIVVYYDRPDAAVMARLEDWARLYDGQWSGLVVTPGRGLGSKIVLTAWTKRLDLDSFEPATAAAFIDAYRGRGPEHPVR